MVDVPPPPMERVVIDAKVEVGYGVAVADVDGDGRNDVVLVDAHAVRWYRAPDWKAFELCGRLTERDHVAVAARDLDGDGKAEIAVAAGWAPDDTTGSGALFWLERGADPTQRWNARELPSAPTLHRIAFVRAPVRGGAEWLLVGLPLHGRGSSGGEGPGARLLSLPMPPAAEPAARESLLGFHFAHGLEATDRDGDGLEELLVAERAGIGWLTRLTGGEFAGEWSGRALTAGADAASGFRGAGEARVGRFANGRRYVASIEPFHGNELVVWLEPRRAGEPWTRRVVDDSLAEGHALRCGDLLGRGDEQIVVGWRKPDASGKTGVRLYVPRLDGDGGEGAFDRATLDGAIACEDLALADLDGDGRQDVVAAGRASHDLVLLLNRGSPPAATPREPLLPRAPLDVAALSAVDAALHEALAQREMRGAVVALGRSDGLRLLRAVGDRAVAPERVAMTHDTLFDLASLTKPLATASSVMALVDDGLLALDDPLSKWLPEFGDARVTLRHCLLHTAGFVPDNDLADYADGPETAWRKLLAQQPQSEPGTRFLYSDVGYELLGRVVEAASGRRLDDFARERLFEPLAMRETGFLPAAALQSRAAPQQQDGDGATPTGRVHDPRAAALGGVAGHAGLFGTALDLARFARMLLNGGTLDGARVLSPAAVALLTTAEPAPGAPLRTPGFDARSRFSSNRGAGMSARAFGHGGFTGTGLWIDPELDLFVIFLSHRLHPDGRGVVNPRIGRIGSIAAAAVGRPVASEAARESAGDDAGEPFAVRSGADLIAATAGGRLAGRTIGLVTHAAATLRDGTPLYRWLHENRPAVDLRVLFTPEHGIAARRDEAIADDVEPTTGLPIVSLYGTRRAPTREQLAGLDTLVFDLQDAGARCYTYASTLGLCMEAAASAGVRFVVLDRPDPIGGDVVGGPLPDSGRDSFTCFHPLPLRHGLTMGELASLYATERGLAIDLEVVELAGWRRAQKFDATLLPWRNPSPNLRTLDAALLYPGLVLLETTSLSVGRGSDLPFQQFGAPWLDARGLVDALTERRLPGVAFMEVAFTPSSSKHAGSECRAVRVHVVDRDALDPLRLVLEIAAWLQQRHPTEWSLDELDVLLCSRATIAQLRAGTPPDLIAEEWAREAAAFAERARPFRRYE